MTTNDLSQYRDRIATEIMGWRFCESEYGSVPDWYDAGREAVCSTKWAPEEDVGQAVQVLEALAAKSWRWAIESWLCYDIQLQPPDAPNDWTRHLSDDGPLPTAIITAVVKAVGWE